ncbi:hypothetical protein AB0D57_27485 [Streptomyces sp. NPDC048275]|uniref:hypothetical protein n=1 Tax=Streptomyces sp. NPDC048275 TaxID=3155629 RepID=UPI0033F34DBE
MRQTEPDFWVLEYVTITKDPRSGLVVAIGGTEKAADILQRTGGFLSAAGPRGDYHRLPHDLPVEQQRLKAATASHTLLAAGHSVHLDPALNALATPDGEHEGRGADRDRRPGHRAAAPHQRSRRPSLDRRQ